jgi:hypothetical protein
MTARLSRDLRERLIAAMEGGQSRHIVGGIPRTMREMAQEKMVVVCYA